MKWILCLAALISPTFAATLSTGTAAWLVNGNPAVIETTRPSNWVPNTGAGMWVGTSPSDGDPNAGAAPGVYTYTLNIGALLGSAGVFSFNYAADNSVVWTITNGTFTSGNPTCLGNCFSTADGAFFTLSGTLSPSSILTGTVINTTAGSTGIIANSMASGAATNTNPTGLFVDGTASAVPEPSTWALLCVSAMLVALRRATAIRP